MTLKKIKPTELNVLRDKLYKELDGICPIMNQHFPVEKFVVDHQHRINKEQPLGENGAGQIRGAINRHANSLEGKIVNNWRRYGMDSYDISLPDFLRNLADYLEKENLDIIHPTELPKPLIVKKASYNKLAKLAKDEKTLPEYRMVEVKGKERRKQKLTKPLRLLFEKYGVTPEFY